MQLYLADASGKVLSRDPSVILPILETVREAAAPEKLPPDHNAAVMKVRDEFAREIKLRTAQREQSRRATPAQKWVCERLLEFYRLNEKVLLQSQIQTVEAALRSEGLPQSVKRELNALQKRKLAGEALWNEAAKIYSRHDLKNRMTIEPLAQDDWPQTVCSMALL